MAEVRDPPLVTVGIPAYNRPLLVRRAIESVQQQQGVSLEMVVVDDGSGDATPEVIRDLAAADARIRPVFHASNRGVNAAKNALFDHARGQFTLFLDSDDELVPGALAEFVRAFDALGADYGMVVMNCIDPATGQWTGLGVEGECDITYTDVLRGRLRGQFSGMWRTALIGSTRFAEAEAAFENTVWFQLYRRGRVRYIPKVAKRYYRDTPGSVVSLRFDPQSASRRLAAAASHLKEYGEDMRAAGSPRLAALHREIVLFGNLAGRRRNALRSALTLVPRSPSGIPLLLASLLPRPLFAWLARRYYGAIGAKIA